MGAGVSQQVLNRAALKRLRALQANINAVGHLPPARYIPATRSAYGRVLVGNVAFSISLLRASNGEAWMNLIATTDGGQLWNTKPMGALDLAWALAVLKGN